MRLIPKRAQLTVSQCADGDIRARMGADISVTPRIIAANIEHGMAVVLMVDAVCGAQHNGAAAILTAHGGRVDSFLLFLVFHDSFHLRPANEFSCGLHRMDRSVRKSVTVSLPRGESNSGSSSEVLKA